MLITLFDTPGSQYLLVPGDGQDAQKKKREKRKFRMSQLWTVWITDPRIRKGSRLPIRDEITWFVDPFSRSELGWRGSPKNLRILWKYFDHESGFLVEDLSDHGSWDEKGFWSRFTHLFKQLKRIPILCSTDLVPFYWCSINLNLKKNTLQGLNPENFFKNSQISKFFFNQYASSPIAKKPKVSVFASKFGQRKTFNF